MIVSNRFIPRRTLLRGVGAAIGLPLLDAMVPAAVALARTAARPVSRLGVIYVPNGMNIWQWIPQAEGTTFEFTPVLQPLSAFRDRLLLLTGMDNHEAAARPGEGVGDHSRAQAAFLTGVHAKKTEGPDFRAGISMDQIVAQQTRRDTQLASLELALEANDMMGVCDSGYSCIYSGTIAWLGPTTPLPMETDPRAVFERMFGDSGSTDPKIRSARIREQRSLLDFVSDDATRLEAKLGVRDRAKLSEYLDAIRDVERRIQKAEEQSALELPVVNQPAGVPQSFEAYAKLMFDLMALAYQSDLTRVATFLMGREVSGRTYPEIGVPDPHHAISHHQDRPELLEKEAKINAFHMSLFAHLIERLRTTPDGDGSLLDHVMVMYGPGFSDSNRHWHKNVPIALAGGGAGRLRGGRHIKLPDGTPLTNLYLSLLDKMGVPTDRLGDSTGSLANVLDV
jgi:hypothetical protein